MQIFLFIKCLDLYTMSPFINLFSSVSQSVKTQTHFISLQRVQTETLWNCKKCNKSEREKTYLPLAASPNSGVFFFSLIKHVSSIIGRSLFRLQTFLASLARCFVILH